MTEGSVETPNVFEDALQRARQLAAKIGIAEKRSLEDEEELDSKRPNNGNMNSLGTPIGTVGVGVGFPGLDPVTVEHMFIPDHMVGLVIGRNGEQISSIQMQSQCRIQMAPDSGGMPERQVTLTGTKNSIEQAKLLIQQVMASKGGAGPPNAYQRAAAAAAVPGAGNHVVEMTIPGPKVGLVIGKSGENLKRIQDELGVRMIVIQESNVSSMNEKPLRIIGPPDMCEVARQRIVEKLASRDDEPPFRGGNASGGHRFGNDYGGQKSLGEVIVPRIAVGVIIGKGGEMIKRMQQETGARVQFKLGEDPNANERTAVLTGSPDQIQKATQMITELVNQAVMKQGGGGGMGGGMGSFGGGGSRMGSGGFGAAGGGSEVFYMHVPSNKTGLVIGKGGETIRQITQESGAQVELSRDVPPNDFEKIFVIRGSAQQIHHAQHMIRIRVGDVAPGTPVPPFTGAATPAASGVGAGYGYGYNFNNAPVQQQQPAQDPNAAWAAYYQYYQQQQAAQAAAQAVATAAYQQPTAAAPTLAPAPAAPVQQPGAGQNQPSINPATGQPDYSAQWAEYYRSLGMHDQAALIEQQAKAAQASQPAAQAAQAQPQQAAYAAYTQQQQAAQYSFPQAQQFAQQY